MAPRDPAPPVTGSPPVHTRRESCRACGASGLVCILDLGLQPLANAFLKSPADFPAERRFPLALYFCPGCGLVQLIDVIDPEVLFGHYVYVTGTSETMAEHSRVYAGTVAELLRLGSTDLVVEIASNDGSLLTWFRQRGSRVLGIEPARNIAELARARGIPTESIFFDEPQGKALRARHGPARAVLANNVLAHVDDPGGFLRGARDLLADDGLLCVEVPYLGEMLERLEYDTVYHEHLSYFSLGALLRLCEAAGLRVVRVDRLPVHGGSIRLYAAPVGRNASHDSEVLTQLAGEERAGLQEVGRLRRFGEEVARSRELLRDLLGRLTAQGRRLAAYGAPAKGNTLLNYCEIGVEQLPFTVDQNPLKVGTFTPGMHLPVLPVSALLEQRRDAVVILAWNFAEEIMRQQSEFLRQGGSFILPLPEPRILS